MIEATRDGMEYYYTSELCSFPTVWFNNYRRVAYIRTPSADSLVLSPSNGRRRTVHVGDSRARIAFLPPLTRSVQPHVRPGRRHRRAMFRGPAHRTAAASTQSRPSRYRPEPGEESNDGRHPGGGGEPAQVPQQRSRSPGPWCRRNDRRGTDRSFVAAHQLRALCRRQCFARLQAMNNLLTARERNLGRDRSQAAEPGRLGSLPPSG